MREALTLFPCTSSGFLLGQKDVTFCFTAVSVKVLSLLGYCNLMMEAVITSEIKFNFYETTRRNQKTVIFRDVFCKEEEFNNSQYLLVTLVM
jgi:hypothetical protein